MKAFIFISLIVTAFATNFDPGFKKVDDSLHYGYKVSFSPDAVFKSADPFGGAKVISYAADDKGFHAQVKADEGLSIKSARLVEVAPVKYTIKHAPEVHYYAGFPFVDSSKTEQVKKIENVGEAPVAPKISFYSGGFPGSIHDKLNHPKPIWFSDGGFPTIKKFDEPSKITHFAQPFSFVPHMPVKEDPKFGSVQFYSSGGAAPIVVHQDKVDDIKTLDFAHTVPVHQGEHQIKQVGERVDGVVKAPLFKISEHHMMPGHHFAKPGVQFFSSGVPVIHEVKELVHEKAPAVIKVEDKIEGHSIKKDPVVTYSSHFPSFQAKHHEAFSKFPIHSSGWAFKPIEVKPVEVIPYSSGGWFQKPGDFPIKKFDDKIDAVPISYSSGWPFTFSSTSSFHSKPEAPPGGAWFKWF